MAVKIFAKNLAERPNQPEVARDLRVSRGHGDTRSLTQRNYTDGRIPAVLKVTKGFADTFALIPAHGQKPPYLHAKLHGVDIHLRDKLEPDENGVIAGMVEVKVRKIAPRNGGGITNYYLYLNIFPIGEGERPTHVVSIEHLFGNESDYERIYVPNFGQEKQQAHICVAPL